MNKEYNSSLLDNGQLSIGSLNRGDEWKTEL